jgi:hypothetical protein
MSIEGASMIPQVFSGDVDMWSPIATPSWRSSAIFQSSSATNRRNSSWSFS